MDYRKALYDTYTDHPSHASADWRDAGLDTVYRRHLRDWLPDDRSLPILDLGCGDGYLAAFLIRAGYSNVVGIDRAAVQVERARELVPEAEILHGDGLELLKDRPAHFGAILCMDVLEHLTRGELLESLPKMVSALVPGGSLIARVPNAESPFQGAIRYGDLTHELAFSAGAISHLFRAIGLESPEFREADPVARSWRSTLRVAGWKCLRQLVNIWNLVETGSGGSGVFTRVMYVRGARPRPGEAP